MQAGLMLHEMIQNAAVPVIGIAQGECGSIALTVLQGCTSRCAEEDVAFLVHFLSFPTTAAMYYDETVAMRIRDTHMSLQEDIIRVHVGRSGITRESFVALLHKGLTLNAAQAQRFGLVDGIVMGSH